LHGSFCWQQIPIVYTYMCCIVGIAINPRDCLMILILVCNLHIIIPFSKKLSGKAKYWLSKQHSMLYLDLTDLRFKEPLVHIDLTFNSYLMFCLFVIDFDRSNDLVQ